MIGTGSSAWQRLLYVLPFTALYGLGALLLVDTRAMGSREAALFEEAVDPQDDPPRTKNGRPNNQAPTKGARQKNGGQGNTAKTKTPAKGNMTKGANAARKGGSAPAETPKSDAEDAVSSPALADPIGSTPGATKKWDLKKPLSDADEIALGNSILGLVRNLCPVETEGEWNDRIFEVAKGLPTKVEGREIPYRYVVLGTPAWNAFSSPGGFIYISRGMLESIGEDEPEVLQFVIAHEMEHIERRHALTCLSDPGFGDFGTVEAFCGVVVPGGYRPNQMDFDADAGAITKLTKLNLSTYEKLAFLRKLEARARADHFLQGNLPPSMKDRRPLLDNHMRAHVSVTERLEKARAMLKATTPKP